MTTPTAPEEGRLPAPAAAPPVAAPARSVAGRAALALALLLGYFVLAAVVVVGLGWLTVQAFASGGSGLLSTKLALFTGVVALAVGRAVFAVERRGEGVEEDGLPVSRVEQPELWSLVDEVSAELSVAAPDTLRLVDDVNAFVHQDTRFLGLVGGRRHMGIGVGLLQVLSVDQLRGVVGHELGHYAGGDTRLSALVHRASATVDRTVDNLGPTSLLGRLFGRYAALYQRVSLAVRRRQELRADAGSVRVVGRDVHAAALREVQAAAAAWDFFLDRYVLPLWRTGAAPDDAYAGYRALLEEPSRQQQLAEVRDAVDVPSSPYDSHPSLSERLAALERLPDRPPPGDTRPARALLRSPEHVERSATEQLTAGVLRRPAERVYAFSGPLDPAPYVSGLDEEGAALARATAAVDGGPLPAGLGRTLAVLEAGRDAELVTALTGDRRDLGEEARGTDLRNVLLGPVALSAACALVASGGARWQASWARPVRLVGPDERELDVAEAVETALDAGGPAAVRPALVRLGVPLEDAAAPAPGADPLRGEQDVVAVWPELVRGRARFDALVTRDEIVLVRQPRSWTTGVRRGFADQYGVGRSGLRAAAAARVQSLLDAPLDDVRRRPDATVLRWDDLEGVRFKGGLASAWVLHLPRPKPLDKLKADDAALVAGPDETAQLLRQLLGDRLDSSV